MAEQLKQVLAERERRLGGNDVSSSRESSGDFSDLNNPHNSNPTIVTDHLVEEIRQAVNEHNQRGKPMSILYYLFVCLFFYNILNVIEFFSS